ncbi:exonuclease SbcCD subunit D [Butyrivibrio sp. FCS014]|uniref:exonuclease SbcCD subunit D n=1 Tax=Butyrivibrio sp. FCS014 TaxID=1408304 RepID=UPI0004664F00|nr:exonuclease SbcCD subunit D [Butyrivibrio sp. FCS014]
MKLLHLSDLHLGKRVNEFSMIEDQKYILKEILTIVGEQKPDGVLIAGDVYDKSVPSEEAMKLWDEFLISLADKKVPVFAISGNHDSAIRFSDHGQFAGLAGIHLSPVYDGKAAHYTLEDGEGPVNIYLLPFIKPVVMRALFPDKEIGDYTDACRVAVEEMQVDESERNILVAHQFVTGATRCESEEVSVGGLDNVDASVFDAFDYVALGHIHGKQRIGRDTLRYCGTPLKYSFSEKDHKKSVTVLELGPKGEVSISEIPLIPKRDLREVRGTYDEITNKKNYEGTNLEDYVHVVLTDENDVIDAAAKLRVIYPNLMKLSYDNLRTRSHQIIEDAQDVERKSPLELFEEFYEKQNNQPMSEEQRSFVAECIESVWEVK